jgi:hypothetical protein
MSYHSGVITAQIRRPQPGGGRRMSHQVRNEVKVADLQTDFLQFQTWLQSADGGLKCEKSAKQHCHQTSVIFKAIDDDLRNISSQWKTNCYYGNFSLMTWLINSSRLKL